MQNTHLNNNHKTVCSGGTEWLQIKLHFVQEKLSFDLYQSIQQSKDFPLIQEDPKEKKRFSAMNKLEVVAANQKH